MFRLIFLAAVFGGGLYAGISAHRVVMDDRCLDAGGRIGANGLCLGVRRDE